MRKLTKVILKNLRAASRNQVLCVSLSIILPDFFFFKLECSITAVCDEGGRS